MAKITRAGRRRLDQLDAAHAKAKNRRKKTSERARRAANVKSVLQAGTLPYPHYVMCWLSRELNKPTSMIVQDDIKAVLS